MTGLEQEIEQLKHTNPEMYRQAQAGLRNVEQEVGVNRPSRGGGRPSPRGGNRPNTSTKKEKSFLSHKASLTLEKQKEVKNINLAYKKDRLTELVNIKLDEHKEIYDNRKNAYIRAKKDLSQTTIDHRRLLDEAELSLKELPLQYRMAKELLNGAEKAIVEMEKLVSSLADDVPQSVIQKINLFKSERDEYRARKIEIALEIKKSVAIKAKLNPKWRKVLNMVIAIIKSTLTLGLAGKYADENMLTIAEIMSAKGE